MKTVYDCIDKRYEALVANIREYFDYAQETLFQKRNTLKIIYFHQEKFVVKSFKTPHLFNQIVYRFFRDSKAKRSYDNSVALLKRGIYVPEPIGFLEYRKPCRLQESYYICRYHEFDFEIRDVIKNKDFENREKILQEFARYSFTLHQKGVYHMDYSPGNVLIKKNAKRYEFTIVDLNRLKFSDYTDELRFKNLSRFSTDSDDLKIIASAYAEAANIDAEYAYETLLKYHFKHQNYLKRKRILKKLKDKR
jgi:tRNA A-37 threonylcarbamoyl transferase component Bud32